MTLRTPRRRFSPRAKRKYRVIRDFFRRALGTSSQQDIKINSSIAVNVTDLKHKIIGIEHQLDAVSKHCQDLAGLESSFRKGTENLLCTESQHKTRAIRSHPLGLPERRTDSSGTKTIYKAPNTRSRKSDESEYVSNSKGQYIEDRKHMTLPVTMNPQNCGAHYAKVKKKKSKFERARVPYECDPVLQKHRTQSMMENLVLTNSASSVHVADRHAAPPLYADYEEHQRDRRYNKRRERGDPSLFDDQYKQLNKSDIPAKYYDENHRRSRKMKQSELDQDFIADLIRKQYRPVKMFGRKHSDISQFSAPVCRDQEYSLREDLMEGAELCSCCYEGELHEPCHPHHHHRHRHELSDNRSICDTRLYSSKHAHARHRRRQDIYNDSAYYDLIPVKEKSSPTSRRKFIKENCLGCEYYKEVPPSPRTHRPRLNLKAQHFVDYEDYIPTKHAIRIYSQAKHKRKREFFESPESDITSEVNPPINRKEITKLLKPAKLQTSPLIHQETGTMSSLQYPNSANWQGKFSATDNNLNKSQDTDSSDKTDKALCEIKDILTHFLQEIKKDASPLQLNKETLQIKQTSSSEQEKVSAAFTHTPSSGPAAFNNYSVPACGLPTSFVPPFTNPCCYPMLPMCPMNCMMPSQNITCHACATSSTKETVFQECSKHKGSSEDIPGKRSETEELIKEIYKFVAENPKAARMKDMRNDVGVKVLTSRSVGGSSRMSKHDAKVGTPAMKCYSKSCEAIGSRMNTDTSYTNATQSDTVLERLNLEATTQSDTELSTESIAAEKYKTSKFANVLRSIGLLKKKKQKETTETESSLEVDVRPRRPPPFRQEIIDYAVHAQEYFNPPPSSPYPPQRPHRQDPPYDPHHDPPYDPHHDPHYDHRYGFVAPPPGCEHRGPYYTPPPLRAPPPPHSYTPHRVHEQTIAEHITSHYPRTRQHSPSPPYSTPYGHDPQVPLCLREIEVKSTGTQSERKMSFFRKLGRKTPPQVSGPSALPISTAGTQTASVLLPKPQTNLPKPALFSGWKKFQEKVVSDINEDPVAYGYRTHKKLAEGDKKMRKAMMKKMFYKKNPFSPNNLIIRTLLGNDPSSFGEPQVKLRTRMFI